MPQATIPHAAAGSTGTPHPAQIADALNGQIDVASRDQLEGWVRSSATPESPISLIVTVDGAEVARILANAYREDLEAAGLGSGRHAFKVRLRNISPLTPCTLRVQRAHDGADIPGSPVVLEAALCFDQGVQDSLACFLDNYSSDDDLKRRLDFLAQQMERLFHLRAERQSGRIDRALRAQLSDRWSNGAASPQQHGLRALVIDAWMPVQGRDAGSNAVTSHMRALQRFGYEVNFVPADQQSGPGVAQLEGFGIICHTRPWSGAVEEVIRRQVDCFDLIYLHRLANTWYLPFIRMFQRRARVIFSVADLASLRLARQAVVEERPELTQYSAQLAKAELSAAHSADVVLTHSAHEAALLRAKLPTGKVHVAPWSVPLAPTRTPWSDRAGLAFIGNYAHPPNIDAAFYLVQEIMPLVWQHDPTLCCTLVGSNMPPGVQSLAGPRVSVAGQVANLAELFEQIRLTVAPINFGAGVKGKVLDSLAAAVPCVCTPVAAEGLDLPASLRAHVAPDPASFAQSICRLHADPACHAAAASDGLAFIATHYQDEHVDACMGTFLGRDLARSDQRPV